MFNFFKSKVNPSSTTVTLQITGMHCTSCALNIDGALEDTDGVIEATTNYARAQTVVKFDPEKVSPTQLQSIIREIGYQTEKI